MSVRLASTVLISGSDEPLMLMLVPLVWSMTMLLTKFGKLATSSASPPVDVIVTV